MLRRKVRNVEEQIADLKKQLMSMFEGIDKTMEASVELQKQTSLLLDRMQKRIEKAQKNVERLKAKVDKLTKKKAKK